MGSITVVGMGPGSFELMSIESWQQIKNAKKLLLRTGVHPTVDEIKRQGVTFATYDSLYEKADDFESLYEAIASDVIAKAEHGDDVTYAVPGSPLVAERTVVLLREKAKAHDVPIKILPSMSFAEVFCTRLGIDPIDGLTIIDAADLEKIPVDFPTSLFVTQVYDPAVASDTKLSLMELLPDDYEIVYAHNLGLPDESIRTIKLFELDRQHDIDHLTSLYIPAMKHGTRFDMTPLTDIMRTLREPGGCPWDREQDARSLRQHILEEAYEVVEAIDLDDKTLLCEELGDLLLQVVFQARIAEEAGEFSMQDVIDGITDKLIRRHPHIFGDVQATDAAAVLKNWEAIKRAEKPERTSPIDGIPQGMAALLAANKLQKKAADVGFDWDKIEPVIEKCHEEFKELSGAINEGDKNHISEEIGDVLFSIVNLSRFLKVNPEIALLETNEKFTRRFHYVEKCVNEAGGDWSHFTIDELDDFWKQAKLHEKMR